MLTAWTGAMTMYGMHEHPANIATVDVFNNDRDRRSSVARQKILHFFANSLLTLSGCQRRVIAVVFFLGGIS